MEELMEIPMQEPPVGAPFAVVVDATVRADVWVSASARSDATVEVRPRARTRGLDVRAAEQAVVERGDGRLRVMLRPLRPYSWFSDGGAVDVVIEVPIGADVEVTSGMGALHCQGELGAVALRTGMGPIHAEHCASLRAKSGMGEVDVERVAGHAEITTGSGKIRIGEIGGDAVVRSGDGDTLIGEVTGELRAKAANGTIEVDRAGSSVTAKSANGGIRIGEVVRGSISVRTAAGSLEVGVVDGTSAWLDLKTAYGRVSHEMQPAEAPQGGVETVEVRARSSYGDITVRRIADPARQEAA